MTPNTQPHDAATQEEATMERNKSVRRWSLAIGAFLAVMVLPVAGQQIKIVSGAVNVYTSNAQSTIDTETATAVIDRDSRVSVDVAPGDKTEVTSFRGRTTVSTGKETVVLEGREGGVDLAVARRPGVRE